MNPMIEYFERSKNGKRMESAEFDDILMDTAMDLVDEYDLDFDLDEIVASDERADAVFEAAVDFLSQVGLYNTTVKRVIPFDKDELLELAADYKANPRTIELGDGDERHLVAPRTSADPRPPAIWAGGGQVSSLDVTADVVKCFEGEDVDGIMKVVDTGEVNGHAFATGTPAEVYCAWHAAKAQGEALAAIGKPGMFRGYVDAPSLGAVLAGFDEGMLTKRNCMVGIHIAPELKIDEGRLICAQAVELMDLVPWTSAMSMVGGLCGGPGGAAMGAVANLLAQLSYGHGKWASIVTTNMQGAQRRPMTLAAASAAHRAVERNIGVATGIPCIDSSVMTCYEESLLAGATIAVDLCASGGAVDWYGGGSPLAARIHRAVLADVAGKPREETNDLVLRLIAAGEKIEAEHEGGQVTLLDQLPEKSYDLATHKPRPEFAEAAEYVVEVLEGSGVSLGGLSLD